jgi:hypothetical protein
MEQNALDLLEKATQKDAIKIEFELFNDGETIVPAILAIGDRIAIGEIQDDVYDEYYQKYVNMGYDKSPMNEARWEGELKQLKNLNAIERLRSNKPMNLADQKAQKNARIRAIQKIVPTILYNTDMTLKYPTEEEQNRFRGIIATNQKLLILLITKYIELLTEIDKVEDAVKNSLELDASKSGEPETQSHKDMGVVRSPKKS